MDICFLKSIVLWTNYILLYMKMHHIWYCIWGNAWIVDMEKWASFILSLIRKSWILWYIGKFKDAYIVLWIGKLIENLFDKNEVENLTNFVEVWLFKVILKLLGYKLCFKVHVTCELYMVLTPCHVWFPGDHPIWFP